MDKVNELIIKGHYTIPQQLKLSSSVKNLINQCLNLDPLKRPSASELLKHDWFYSTEPASSSEIFTSAELRQLQ